MKKLIAMTILIALTVSCFFTGCQSSESGETDGVVTVRTNVAVEPDSLDPWKSAAADTEAIFYNVFEGLVSFDETGKIVPGLAKSWEISPDGTEYTFKLNENVTFHNGKKMTSEDVVYSLSALAGLNEGSEPVKGSFTIIKSAEAIDDFTVKVTLDGPSATFLAMNIEAILPKGYTEQATKPVGTGPFMFSEYVPGQKIVLVKNENYYNEEKIPAIDRAEIMIMTDAGAVVSALKAGTLDFANITSDNVDVLKDEFNILTSCQNMVNILGLNNSKEPLNNKNVRKAISLAIDKQEIIDGAFAGYATELYSNFSPIMAEYYNDELEDEAKYDVEEAKALLKEEGYENGFDLTITVPGNYKQHVDTALIIAEQLKKININVKLDVVEWATWLEKVNTNANYEATVIGFAGKLDPHEILKRYTTGYKKNFIRFNNAEYDEAISQAARETDKDERIALYKEAQKLLLDDSASVFICDPNITIAAKKNLMGYTFYPINFIDFSKLYYAE